MAQHFLLSRAAKTLTLAQVMRMGSEEAETLFRNIRWPDTNGKPVCPHCGGAEVYDMTRPGYSPRWQCKACRKKFSTTSGTLFAWHKLPVQMYLAASAVRALLEGHAGRVHALSHVTGGGLPGNLPRVLPDGLGFALEGRAWARPAIFELIARGGPVDEHEMRRTFNLGVGLVCIVDPGFVGTAIERLRAAGEAPGVIGVIERVDPSTPFEDRVRFVA